MIAHIRNSDGTTQSLTEHSRNVQSFCRKSAEGLGLSETASLIGLLHDMGKACDAFSQYLYDSYNGKTPSVHPLHAATGAFFAYKRWFNPKASKSARLCAQTIAMCILGHHTGLCNVLDFSGKFEFREKLIDHVPVNYDSVSSWFCENIASEDELDLLFQKARVEFESIMPNYNAFNAGLFMRLLLGILVDADRYDAACFEYGIDSLDSDTQKPNWHDLFKTFENFRENHLIGDSPINKIRSEISDACLKSADKRSKIVTLTVPTGGGKTFSTLRYALKYAETFNCERIFYIIPYNTILDQNSRDIRKALNDYDGILEHHANVVIEDENELRDYTRLTERWDSTIILTSLVRFLDFCYKGKNSDARRFPRLANSVLIFDEIQSLPKKCKTLFEKAILFLTEYCGAQAVLCTATQPNLKFGENRTIQELMPNTSALFSRLERVKYFPELGIYRTNQDAAVELTNILERKSVLAVVNTKIVASDIYTLVKQILEERGLRTIVPDCSISEDNIKAFVSELDDDTILCVHLTTLLCPAHRLSLIEWIKTFTRLGRKVFCISTALIEAGVNLSFPVAIRSLAGLTSIVQAAGRCNRNMEAEFGEVRIWALKEEKLSRLEEIQIGQKCTRALISNREYERGFDHPETVKRYFVREACNTKEIWNYPIKGKNITLVDLLGKNESGTAAFCERYDLDDLKSRIIAKQGFREAGEAFEVIPDNTKSIIVPFGEGTQIIAALSGSHSPEERRLLLKKTQAYSVSVYANTYDRLDGEGALCLLDDCGVVVLREGYYSNEVGVSVDRGEMELMVF